MEVERSPDWEVWREKQRALIEQLRDRFPAAEVSEAEHFEHVEGRWRAIPCVVVEFPTGQHVTFFAEEPTGPPVS